ncbi:hypothetical protein SAMN05421786_1011241 [Chryseobacterium ureilyticum]|uniref:YD repeat-containing protein n=1 Tax=Chryseobacterium ureilyticum TaxID=373668 RepID=A0A1N7LEK7_9FLAO|nr:hypothetical protein [Chryseobacterium ureilyticum]SIS72221.1 hypothetical protein SAMN05421786_1011241 [Chryseobacterium ureilyticum]
MKRKILYLVPALYLNTAASLLYGQTLWRNPAIQDIQNIQVNKPEIGKLNDLTVSDDNVNLSTGELSPNIGLTEIKTKSLIDPIILSYKNGKGIRVNDISSDIGLGWDIGAGGSITRKVNGFPDDVTIYINPTIGVEATNPRYRKNYPKFINGWLDYANWAPIKKPKIPYLFPGTPSNNEALGGAIQRFAQKIINKQYGDGNDWFRFLFAQGTSELSGYLGGSGFPMGGGLTIADLGSMSSMGWTYIDVDGEPDEFYFNFGKYSGKFVFDGNRAPVTIPHIPGLKIESPFNSDPNTWLFTTPEGTKYYFSHTPEYTETLYSETNAAPSYDDWMGKTPEINEGVSGNEYISKWFLSKVVAVNGDTIDYNYEQMPDLLYSEKSEIKEVFKPSVGSTKTPPAYFINSGDKGFYERVLDRTTQIRIKGPKRLSLIKTSDNNTIKFEYNGLTREDIDQSQTSPSDKRRTLSSIKKFDFNSKLIEKLDFNQSYFSSQCPTYDCKRLKLDNVRRIGADESTISAITSFQYFDESLPQRNNFHQDYWGYYNNNNRNTLIPKVYTMGAMYDYPGADRTPSEEKAKASMLKKIVYPTKGSVEYEYELNDFGTDFEFPTNPVTNNKTGGLRIKKISKRESENVAPIVQSFTYKLSNGKSSGELPELLRTSTSQEDNNGAGRMFERQKIVVNEDTGQTSVYIMIYSTPKYLFTDDLLRYSRVVVDTEGKGSTEYLLSSFNTDPDYKTINYKWSRESGKGFRMIPQFMLETGYIYNIFNHPTIHTPDKSYARGLVLSKIEKDSSGKTLRETINKHNMNPTGYSPKQIFGVGTSSIDSFLVEDSDIQSMDFVLSFYKSDYVYLESTKVNDYSGNNSIVNSESNNYNNFCLLQNKNTLFSNNDLLEVRYKYAYDKSVQKLIDANIINLPIETEASKNGKLISKSEIKYDNAINIYPSSILSYNFLDNTARTDISYDLYDDKGNLLQYTTKGNQPVTIIWGYKSTEPIAKIEGITYSELASKLGFSNTNMGYKNLQIVNNSNADTNNDYEDQTLIPSLDDFRNNPELSQYRITTYTYDPLIGVKSITPPSGIRESYIYNSAGRLEKIVDVDGKLLKEFKYNYKN